jgi:ABC-type branched-subunit amino acid transport system ATPase component
VVSFILAAVPCGIAGAYYVYSQVFISPGSVEPTLSINVLAGLVIGGSGTIVGPILGTGVVSGANQFLGSFEKYQGLVFGTALIAVAAVMPDGVVGMLKGWVLRFTGDEAHENAGRGQGAAAAATMPKGIVGTLKAWMPDRPATAPPVAGSPAEVSRRTADRPTPASPVPAQDRPAALRAEPLRVEGVSRSFGGLRAVVDVTLSVEPGQVHALVGPNGSGKTTVLNLITGYYRVGGGDVRIGPERLDRRTADQIARLGVARTFQTPRLLIGESALANVVLGADRNAPGSLVGTVLHTRRARHANRVAVEQASDALQWVGLDQRTIGGTGVLSHGTQRLVEIARAMTLQPRFLLLDEPAAGLSIGEVEVLQRVVRSAADAGLGVLLVEHNLPVVFGLADTVTVLHQGEVIATGSPEAVSSHPKVVEVYLGRQRRPGDVPGPMPTDGLG